MDRAGAQPAIPPEQVTPSDPFMTPSQLFGLLRIISTGC